MKTTFGSFLTLILIFQMTELALQRQDFNQKSSLTGASEDNLNTRRRHRHKHQITSETPKIPNPKEEDYVWWWNDDESINDIVDVNTSLELPDSPPDVPWPSTGVVEFQGSATDVEFVDDNLLTETTKTFIWSQWSSCSSTCSFGTQTRTQIKTERNCSSECQRIETRNCSGQMLCSMTSSNVNNSKNQVQLSNETPNERNLRITPDKHDPTFSETVNDTCKQWMECDNVVVVSLRLTLINLPDCPCLYPLMTNDSKIWSAKIKSDVKWTKMLQDRYKLHIFKPMAEYCIRTSDDITGISAQQCCYDSSMKLLTRGSGAGTPLLVSPDISEQLHRQADIIPWLLCKGDWTRYNQVRKPNNGLKCTENPYDDEFKILKAKAKEY